MFVLMIIKLIVMLVLSIMMFDNNNNVIYHGNILIYLKLVIIKATCGVATKRHFLTIS